MKLRLGWLVALSLGAVGSTAAFAESHACDLTEAWDDSMAMCMPKAAGAMSNSAMYDMMTSPDGCGPDGYFHFGMAMCLEKPRVLGRFSGMLMGNLFLAADAEQGSRGKTAFVAPNWLMANLGVNLASWNRLELDIMLTAERWTIPENGYPLLFQIGESNAQGQPFIDAQHPHSSPLMGLVLTDVISFSQLRTRLLRLWFAPRGESTDGPIAMMHRPTGTVNPDAPLGHHVGQDVGHVTSTVIGASLYIGKTLLEASAFHGKEPSPTKVDLPIGVPDSVSVRLVQQFRKNVMASASFAYVTDPEGDPTIPHEFRISASAYTQWNLPRGWRAHTTSIWGGITRYDHADFLNSFTFEGLFSDESNAIWSRLEVLQRTPAELNIVSSAPNVGEWIGAVTLGYTRKLFSLWAFDFSLGGSGSIGFVPPSFSSAYGGQAIVSGKLFLEARLMKMFAAGKR